MAGNISNRGGMVCLAPLPCISFSNPEARGKGHWISQSAFDVFFLLGRGVHEGHEW